MTQGIYWLETSDWGDGHLKTTTVSPAFRYLKAVQGIPNIPRKVAGFDQFSAFLNEWAWCYAGDYRILYLAFHGQAGRLIVGDDFEWTNWLDLDDIERQLGRDAAGCVVYFASCATMDVDKSRLQEFIRNTGCAALCGYRGPIHWMDSAVFDLMPLAKMSVLPRIDGAGLRSAKAFMKAMCGGLYENLQFRMVISD
jgi:hypothetical protein